MNAPERLKPHGTIGDLLVARGVLQPEHIDRVIARQHSHDEPFGEAAIALKLLQRSDLDAALSTQFNYGYLHDNDTHLSRELVTAFKPFSSVSEEMRALRGQIMLRWLNDDRRRRMLSVVSPQAQDGRSFIAANLAVVFSQQGQRTLLIDANLRQPRQAEGEPLHQPGLPGGCGRGVPVLGDAEDRGGHRHWRPARWRQHLHRHCRPPGQAGFGPADHVALTNLGVVKIKVDAQLRPVHR